MKLTQENLKVLENRYELFQKHFKNRTDSYKLQGQTQIDDDMIEVKPIIDPEYFEFFKETGNIRDKRSIAKLWFSKIGKGRFVFVKEASLWYEWSGLIWEPLSKENPGIKAMNLLSDDLAVFLANVLECNEIETTIKDMIMKNIEKLKDLLNNKKDMCNEVVERALVEFSKELIIDAMDTQMEYLTFKNNIVLNTETLEYTNCKAYYYQTRMLPYNFPVTPSMYKDCPNWKKTLNDIFEGEEDKISFIKNFAGYLLFPRPIEEKMLFMVGRGYNGKSTVCVNIANVLGKYSLIYDQKILNKKFDQKECSHLKVKFKGKYFALIKELPDNMILNEAMIKDLASRDDICGRALYQDTITFKPSAKLMLMTNHEPVIKNCDFGIRRRILMINFNRRFEGNEVKDIDSLLIPEYEGIMHWILEGLIMCKINLETRKSGCLDIPEKIMLDTDDYFSDDNILELFYKKYFKQANKTDKLPISEIYSLYKNFTEENENDFDEKDYSSISKKIIDVFLKQKGHTIKKSTGNKRYVFGIDFIDSNPKFQESLQDEFNVENSSPQDIVSDSINNDEIS